MIKKLLSTAFIFFFFVNVFAQKKPDWIKDRPIDNNFFIGISFSPKTNASYLEDAKLKALTDISEQISVTLSSETFLKTTEVDNEVKQSFESNIKANVQRNIEGYEIVDTWQDKNEYWVYLRLSKTAYYAAKQKKIESALKFSNQMIETANENFKKGELSLGLQNLLLASKSLEPYTAETFDLELKNKTINQYAQIQNLATSVLTKVKFLFIPKEINLKPGKAINEKIIIQTSYSEENIKVKNTPLILSFEKGSGNLSSKQLVTDENGFSKTELLSIENTKTENKIKVQLDSKDLIKGYEDVVLASLLKKRSNISEYIFVKEFVTTLYFKSVENNFGKAQSVKIIENSLKDFFKANGFVFTANQNEADYVVNINADTRDGGKAFDMAIAYVDFSLTLTEQSSQKEVYSKQVNNVKGVKLDTNSAGNEAYRKFLNANYKTEVEPGLAVFFNLK